MTKKPLRNQSLAFKAKVPLAAAWREDARGTGAAVRCTSRSNHAVAPASDISVAKQLFTLIKGKA